MKVKKLRVTELVTYDTCPYCFWLQQKGAKRDDIPALSLGSEMHSALENYHLGKTVDTKSEQVLDWFMLYQEKYPDPKMGGKPMDIEWKFEISLVRPDYNRDLGIVITGRPDLIVGDTIYEHKTSSSIYHQYDVDDHFQMTAYMWAFYEMYGKIPRGIFNIFMKQETPRLDILKTERNMDRFLAWFDRLERILEGIRNDWFTPSDHFYHGFPDCPGNNT